MTFKNREFLLSWSQFKLDMHAISNEISYMKISPPLTSIFVASMQLHLLKHLHLQQPYIMKKEMDKLKNITNSFKKKQILNQETINHIELHCSE